MTQPNLLVANSNAINYSATDSSGATRITLPQGVQSIRVVNESSDIAFFAIAASPTATVPGSSFTQVCTPVLGGSDVIFGVPQSPGNPWQFAAICRSTKTATLTVQCGYGQ